jgi:hypothetical protein
LLDFRVCILCVCLFGIEEMKLGENDGGMRKSNVE